MGKYKNYIIMFRDITSMLHMFSKYPQNYTQNTFMFRNTTILISKYLDLHKDTIPILTKM